MQKVTNLLLALSASLLLSTAVFSQKTKITEIPVTTSSADATMLFKQGLAYFDQGNNRKARELFNQAIEKDPKLAIAYMYLANTANTPKEFASALEKARVNISGASEWEKAYLEYNQSFLSDDWNKRLSVVKRIVTQYPDAARAQVDLGDVYNARKDYAMARQSYQRAVELDPGWVGGYNALANSYIFGQPKDLAKAEQYARKAVEVAPQSAAAQNLLGDALRAQQKLEEAKNAYTKALEIDPENFSAYMKRGHTHTYLGDFAAARQDYEAGRKYAEDPAGAVMYASLTYLYENQPQQALQALMEEIKKIDATQNASSKYNLLNNAASIALHHGETGQLKEIIQMMEPLADQVGSESGTREAKLSQKANVQLWKASLQALEGNYAGATVAAEAARTTLQPLNNPRKLETYELVQGYISYKKKDFDKAIKHFQKADATSVYDQYWLGKAYEAAGQKEKAMNIYQKIANYNFNMVGYALIRNEVKEKSGQ